WITESIKKGDAIVSHGECAIALLGVWNFRESNPEGGTVALPDWQHVALNGREVRIVFDSDVMEKENVAHALKTLAAFLRSKGARVQAIYLPSEEGEKVGIDDYLLTHSLADAEHLIEAPDARETTRAYDHAPGIEFKCNEKTSKPLTILGNVVEV